MGMAFWRNIAHCASVFLSLDLRVGWEEKEVPDGNASRSVEFVCRLYDDGTIAAICLKCFLTIARADSEADLYELASAHQCPDLAGTE